MSALAQEGDDGAAAGAASKTIALPRLPFPHEPAAAAHAVFRGFVGRHDRDAAKDGIVLGRGRLCATHRRPQSDPSFRTFCGAYIVRQADRAWALYREPDFCRARHTLAGAWCDLYFADAQFPRPGEDWRHRGGHGYRAGAHSGKVARSSVMYLRS